MSKAERLYDPNPPKVDRSKIPTADEVRESIRADAGTLLPPFFKRLAKQRGLGKYAIVRIKQAA